MGGKDLGFDVVLRGQTRDHIKPGTYVFFQREREHGGCFWFGQAYDDWFGFTIEEPVSLRQGMEKWCKEAIVDGGPKTFSNGRTLQNMKGVNTAGWAAAFHGSAITTLFELLELALTDPETAKDRINEIKGMVVTPTPMPDSEKVFGALTWDEMPADTDFTNSDLHPK